jgi:natural product biosynthesis luciferase-like monooxygenase protein/amino acid adenylation domain-containing protein
MSNNKVLNFIYDLLNNGIKIFLQNGNIKLLMPDNRLLDNDQKSFIKDKKQDILDYLQRNKVYSDNYDTLILHDASDRGPLSFAQERLWFIEQYEEGTNAYVIPLLLKVSTTTNLEILAKSIRAVVARHEVLRTIIKETEENSFYQLVLEYQSKLLSIAKIKVLDRVQLDLALCREVNRIYNLSEECPIRVTLYELIDKTKDSTDYYLSIVVHHIAFDGWSADILLQEVREIYHFYDNHSQDLETNLLPLSIQYKDFALWQRHYLSGYRLKKLLEFWKEKLQGYEELNLLIDKKRPKQINYEGNDIYFELDEVVSKNLRALAKKLKVTLYSLLLSGYYLMLRCYTNQNDIVVGTPLSNRNYSQIENLIGFFINSLPIRIQIESQVSIKEFVQKIQDEIIQLQSYQDLPFEKLVEELNLEQDLSKHPIFQIMFGVQSFAVELKEKKSANAIAELYYPEKSIYKIARFDITTFIDDGQDKLKGSFNYAVNLFNESTILGFIETYLEILKQFANIDSETQIGDIEYLSQEQYVKTICDFNRTDKNYNQEKLIHQLFEEQVERTPDAIALSFKDTKFTYKQLNEESNKLASYINTSYNIKPNTIIALCLDRNAQMVIGVLGILKSGGSYLPIDSSLPDQRIRYMLDDSQASLLLTQSNFLERFSDFQGNIVNVEQNFNSCSLTNVSYNIQDLMYVIYTSGSTGEPKGVQVTHKNVSNFLEDMSLRFDITEKDCWVSVTTISFDISVLEIFLPLIKGAHLVISPSEVLSNPEELIKLINKVNCSIMQATPSTWQMLIGVGWRDNKMKILCGGEEMNRDLAMFFQRNENVVWNLYGPTETTIWSSVAQLGNLSSNLDIGNPIANTQIYVLNNHLKMLPCGAIGEICIAGDGVSNGYLNKPELTKDKFVNYVMPNGDTKKLYRTGDLGRWSYDGYLEYRGRQDFQVKVRGYRIELGEIEEQLMKHEAIEQAVVIPFKIDNHDTRIIAHVVPSAKARNKKLQFSLFYFSAISSSQSSPYYLYLESAKFADQNSFYAIWTPERHFHEVGGQYPNPSVLSSYLASITNHIQIRAGSVVLPLHHPIRIVEEWSVIDNFSNGRVGIAFASGWNAKDFVFFPEKYQQRKQIMFSDLQKVRALWRGEQIEFVDGVDQSFLTNIFPKPIQKELPTWVTTSFAKETFIEAGKIGANILTHLLGQNLEDLAHKITLYRKSLKDCGYNPQDYTVTLMLHTFVTDSTERALSISQKPFCEYLKSHISLLNMAEYVGKEGKVESEDQLNEIIQIAFTRYSKNSSLIGSVEECLKTVVKMKNIGVDEFACFIDFGIEEKQVIDNLPYLAELKSKSNDLVNLDLDELNEYLKESLPSYMIPYYFIPHQAFRFTHNGKLDRKWLITETQLGLQDQNLMYTISNNYVAPKTKIEKKICKIWAEVLNLPEDSIGMVDDFFRLGGHSILAIKLVSRLNKELNCKLTISSLFQNKTPKNLIDYLSCNLNNKSRNLEVYKANIVNPKEFALSFAQERLWFIEQYEEGTNAYNTPLIFQVLNNINIIILQQAIQDIFARHEILRTLIKSDNDGNIYQQVLSVQEHPLEIRKLIIFDYNNLNSELEKEVKHIYDLSHEYPIRVCLYELASNKDCEYYLSIVIHHIAFDGWSVDVLFRELCELYDYYQKRSKGLEEKLNLPDLRIQYKDFAVWQKNYLHKDILQEQLEFWGNKLINYETLNLIADKPRPKHVDYTGNDIFFEIDEPTSQKLRRLAKEFKVSLYSLLLSGYYLMLKRYSGQEDIILGTPIANRHYGNVGNLIGCFVNSLPIRIKFSVHDSIKEFIEKVGEEVVQAQLYQDLPFEKLVKELNIHKDVSRHPIFQVMFGVRSTGDQVDHQSFQDISSLLKPHNSVNLHRVARFDITTLIDDSQIALQGSFNYAVSIFYESTIKDFIETYLDILKQFVNILPIQQEQVKISDIACLTHLPVNTNTNWGKKELTQASSIYIRPSNTIERRLCSICANVLRLEEFKVSIHDDFFRLGGDSILVMKLMTKIKHEFGVNIPLKTIFNSPTLFHLSQNLLSKLSGVEQLVSK